MKNQVAPPFNMDDVHREVLDQVLEAHALDASTAEYRREEGLAPPRHSTTAPSNSAFMRGAKTGMSRYNNFNPAALRLKSPLGYDQNSARVRWMRCCDVSE
jgi:hypothetical protein